MSEAFPTTDGWTRTSDILLHRQALAPQKPHFDPQKEGFSTPSKTRFTPRCTEHGENHATDPPCDPLTGAIPDDLWAVVEAWDRLPERVRARIVGVVEGAIARR